MKLRRRAAFTDLSRPRLGETVARPTASGVHVSALSALGFSTYKDGQGLRPRPSHPTEDRTLDGLDAQ